MEPSDAPDPSATVLYVGNLDRRVTDVMMLNILKTGLSHIKDKIQSAKVFAPNDPMQGPDGYCFVHFDDNLSASQAMTFLNGREFCGKKVKVNWATNSTNGGMPKVIGSSVTIFVGDLDDDICDAELRQAFDPFGEILNAKVVRDPVTDKSKNYGFISFTNKPDAERAIREMHGAMLKRRPIKTNWATRNQKTQPSSLDYDEVFNESKPDNTTVYVTNLPDRISEDLLYKHFESYGKIMGNPRVFEGKNFAFIKFDSHAAATTAIVKTNGSELNGAILKCWWGKDGGDSGYSGGGGGGRHHNTSSHMYGQSQTNTQDNQSQMTPQQYMQYMMQYNQAYYYQYWMQYQQQMYQQQMQGGQQPQGAQQQQGYQYPYQQPAYQQQQPQQENGALQQQQSPPEQGDYNNGYQS